MGDAVGGLQALVEGEALLAQPRGPLVVGLVVGEHAQLPGDPGDPALVADVAVQGQGLLEPGPRAVVVAAHPQQAAEPPERGRLVPAPAEPRELGPAVVEELAGCRVVALGRAAYPAKRLALAMPGSSPALRNSSRLWRARAAPSWCPPPHRAMAALAARSSARAGGSSRAGMDSAATAQARPSLNRARRSQYRHSRMVSRTPCDRAAASPASDHRSAARRLSCSASSRLSHAPPATCDRCRAAASASPKKWAARPARPGARPPRRPVAPGRTGGASPAAGSGAVAGPTVTSDVSTSAAQQVDDHVPVQGVAATAARRRPRASKPPAKTDRRRKRACSSGVSRS